MAATTASGATPSTTLTMKLLVDSRPLRRRVVFAEAGKDTVDFLFSLLAMPAGTAVKLLGKESMAGSMGNLYGSAEKLDDGYVHPGAASKDAVLCATVPTSPAAAGPNSSLLFRLPPPEPTPEPRRLFVCGNYGAYGYNSCRPYVTEVRGTRCPNCGSQITADAKIIGAPPEPPPARDAARRGGFVQGGAVTYTVTDDHVQRLQHRAAQRLRREGPRGAPGEDRAHRLQGGSGDSQGLAAVQDCAHCH